jgi:hypothetical protein
MTDAETYAALIAHLVAACKIANQAELSDEAIRSILTAPGT